MKLHTQLCSASAAVSIAAAALVPSIAAAQTASAGDWQFAGTIYGYLPTIGGSSSFPVDSAGNPVSISTSQILDALKMTFMGSLDAHNGQWGVFTDILYLDRLPGGLIPGTRDELRIIPARASFKHARMLHEESAQQWHEPQLAEAAMLHLDDPHYDALIAIKDGAAAAHAGVLAVGRSD